MLELFNESNSMINHKEYPLEIKSSIVPIQRTNQNGYPLSHLKSNYPLYSFKEQITKDTLFQTNNSMYPSVETH
jgi:hypothetical protein